MRLVHASAVAFATALLIPAGLGAQNQDADRSVAGGGIMVEGWKGKVDAQAASRGSTIDDSKFMAMGGGFHAQIGPAGIYWNPENAATGTYTVTATFKETKTDMGHPHPAGLFIGGQNLETDQQQYLYCTVYGTGEFLVNEFTGGAARPTSRAARQAHDAINKPAADGSATNEVAWRVTADRAECVVNGTVVAGFARSELGSTEGIVGLRFSHNMDAMVSGFAIQRD
jgi:hypothetical protein